MRAISRLIAGELLTGLQYMLDMLLFVCVFVFCGGRCLMLEGCPHLAMQENARPNP